MRDIKIREWTTVEPRQKDIYAAELETGRVYPIIAWRDAGHLYLRTIMGGEIPEKITRYYGPLTTDELLAGIPQPPPRLPKAHPDRYLASVADMGDVLVAIPAAKPDEEDGIPRWLIHEIGTDWWSTAERSELDFLPDRFAQQDTDGVWREVEV